MKALFASYKLWNAGLEQEGKGREIPPPQLLKPRFHKPLFILEPWELWDLSSQLQVIRQRAAVGARSTSLYQQLLSCMMPVLEYRNLHVPHD